MNARATITARLGQVRSLARVRPFDTSTEAGRSKERYRRIAHTAAAQAVARGVTVLTTLLTVPLTVHYLGPERYGIWLTISSFIAMLAFADLGLGNGLISEVSAAHGRDDRARARRVVSSAAAMLSGTALLTCVLFAAAYPFINFGAVFDVKNPDAIAQAGPALAVMLGCFAVNMPLAVVQRCQMGFQEGVAANMWGMLGNILQLGLLLVVIQAQGGLVWLVAAMAGGPALATLASAVYFFGRRRPWLMPRASEVDRGTAVRLLKMGVLFLILQVASSLAFTSDNIVIAQVLGTAEVTQYGVPVRLFSVIAMISTAVLAPLWPAYGESFARGDFGWVRRTLIRSLLLTLATTTLLALPMVVFGRELLHLWVRDGTIQPSMWLLSGLGVWSVLSALGITAAMFFNGCHRLMPQVVCAILLAVVGPVAKVVGAKWAGVDGVIWSTVLSYTFLAAIPLAILIVRILREMSAKRLIVALTDPGQPADVFPAGPLPGAPRQDME